MWGHPPHQAALSPTRLPLTWQQAGPQVSTGTAYGAAWPQAGNQRGDGLRRKETGGIRQAPASATLTQACSKSPACRELLLLSYSDITRVTDIKLHSF